MRSTRGTLAVPNAIAPIAPAPPIANTRSTREISAAASTTPGGRPSAPGGEHSTICFTPAARAGIAAMSTLLG